MMECHYIGMEQWDPVSLQLHGPFGSSNFCGGKMNWEQEIENRFKENEKLTIFLYSKRVIVISLCF